MIKLIAADLDGTLLDGEKRLPKGFFRLIKRLDEAGVIFAAVSGRQYFGVEQLFLPVKDDMLFIAENGGIAFEKGKKIYSLPLPETDVKRMTVELSELYDRGVRVLLSGERGAYVLQGDPAFMSYALNFCPRVSAVESFDRVFQSDSIIKIAVLDENAENGVYPLMKSLEPDFNVILSAKRWVDIVGKNVNKGRALANLMKHIGAGYDEAMAFGDYLNDYEMMSCCAYSYAMENAHPALKEAAAFSAPSNEEDGVARAVCERLGIDYNEIRGSDNEQ